jgi:hypothetical protein
LRAGESRELTFTVSASDLPDAAAEVSVGGGQPLGKTPRVTGTLAAAPSPSQRSAAEGGRPAVE